MYVGFSKLYEDDNLNVCSNGINIRDVQRYALKSTSQFSEVVSSEFSSYIQSKRRKDVHVAALSLMLTLMSFMVREDELSFEDGRMPIFQIYGNSTDDLYSCGLFINFSKNNSFKGTYTFDGTKFSHSTLIKAVNYLESIDWLVHENGYCILDSASPYSCKEGLEFVNYANFYTDFYSKHWDLINDYLAGRLFKCIERPKDRVVVREKKEVYDIDPSGKCNKHCQKVQLDLKKEGLNSSPVVKNSRKFLKRLEEHYATFNVGLVNYEALDETRQLIVKQKFVEKRNDEFNVELLNGTVLLRNNNIKKCVQVPQRIFHRSSTGELVFGRIYHNKAIIDRLDKFLVPMLVIDGKFVSEVDIKSCLLQLFVLEKFPGVDNKQDFYSYKAIEDLPRKDIKLLVQCLLFNSDEESARRSFDCTMKKNRFKYLVDMMFKEKPYLKKIFYKPEMSARILRVESDFMISVMESLIDKGVKFLYHFDSIIVPNESIVVLKKTINECSNKRWSRDLNLDSDF